MKKLLIVTDNFLPRWDGISKFLYMIIPEIKKDYEITIIAPKFKGKMPKVPGVKIIRMPIYKKYLGDIQASKLNFKKIKQEVKKTDIVWIQSLGVLGIKSIIYSKIYKKKLIAI